MALELPPEVETELDWAASCWPGPVVAASPLSLFPFVPGDSIFEAFRAARTRGTKVVLVDLPLSPPVDGHEDRPGELPLLGPEFAPRAGGLFLEATDALLAAPGPPRERDLAREAHMAAALSALMAENERVMWVGGMAHWSRIVARLADAAFDTASVTPAHPAEFKRMRLAPSALYRMTGRSPWLVARYGVDPGGFNLALTAEVRERPDFGELLLAAAATIGPRYAGRLYETGTAERASDRALQHAALEWDVKDGHERYRCGDEVLGATPYRPASGGLLVGRLEVRRRARDELYKGLPTGGDGKRACMGVRS